MNVPRVECGDFDTLVLQGEEERTSPAVKTMFGGHIGSKLSKLDESKHRGNEDDGGLSMLLDRLFQVRDGVVAETENRSQICLNGLFPLVHFSDERSNTSYRWKDERSIESGEAKRMIQGLVPI
jgi:hypothetical protein